MRIFAISDLHIDYGVNADWLKNLSHFDYQDDVLILAGDISDNLKLLTWCFRELRSRFKKVLFVPGNHDLWILRSSQPCSLEKYNFICTLAADADISLEPFHSDHLSIVPLLGWYDYSFGKPSDYLSRHWMDYFACSWPDDFEQRDISLYFMERNAEALSVRNDTIISFSHFLPRIDVMPKNIPEASKLLYPILGSSQLDNQLRKMQSKLHVYGHSHINRRIEIDGVLYVNNAFGYPSESHIAKKSLCCVYEA